MNIMQIFLEVGKNIFGMFKVVKTNQTTSEIFAFHFGIKFVFVFRAPGDIERPGEVPDPS